MPLWNSKALLLLLTVLLVGGFVLALYTAGWPDGNPAPVVPFRSPS
jgi:hypothetical protein